MQDLSISNEMCQIGYFCYFTQIVKGPIFFNLEKKNDFCYLNTSESHASNIFIFVGFILLMPTELFIVKCITAYVCIIQDFLTFHNTIEWQSWVFCCGYNILRFLIF